MIKALLQIEDSEPRDTVDEFNMIYMSSDNIFAPTARAFESTTHSGKSGKNIDPRVTFEPFDFKTEFLVYREPLPYRNLVLDTAKDTGWSMAAKPEGYYIDPLEGGGVIFTSTSNSIVNEYIRHTFRGGLIKEGVTYTLSFDIAVSTDTPVTAGELDFANAPSSGVAPLTPWKKFLVNLSADKVWQHLTWTFTATASATPETTYYLHFNPQSPLKNNWTKLRIRNLILCEGSTDRPWIKAPEDTPDLNRAVTLYNKAVTSISDNFTVCKKVTLHIPYKRLKITGYARPIGTDDITEFYRVKGYETSKVQTVICVSDPTLCDFDYDADQ